MTAAQKRLRELLDKQSRERGRMAEISNLDTLTPEIREEMKTIETGTPDLELQIRAARAAVDAEQEPTGNANTGDNSGIDPETRERLELRSRVAAGRYIAAALRGAHPKGAEAEYLAATGQPDGSIPFDLWEQDRPEIRADAVTGTPATVGVNLQPVQPYFFARAVLPRLGVAMPAVESGTYSIPTISTPLTAGAKAKGAAQESTAAAMSVVTATPKRISARLSLRIEDLAAVGSSNFESALRENLAMALSAELDDQGLNGDGTAPNLNGLIKQVAYLNNAAPSMVFTFAEIHEAVAEAIDGNWAESMSDLSIVFGVETYRKMVSTFPSNDDSVSTMVGLKGQLAQMFTSSRMPAPASTIQDAIAVRGSHMVTRAVCPHHGRLIIDDIYTGSASGEKNITAHVILGDILIVHQQAFSKLRFKVAAS